MSEAAYFDLTPAMPEVFLFFAGLILLVVGALREKDAPAIVTPLTVLALLVAIILTMSLDTTSGETFNGHFVFDGLSSFIQILVLVGAAISITMARPYLIANDADRFEFPILALFSALGMTMMASANSFLALYMALELLSLPLYVMAAIQRDTLRSTEAGLKYFVLGALASGLILYGCSLVYGFTGTLSFSVLASGFSTSEEGIALSTGALVGIVFLVSGLAFKLSAVPFHMWAPDVYEGSPTPVTAFLATAPKVAAVGITLRLLYHPFGEWVDDWQQVVALIAAASMLLGAFAAIGQTNIKRLMAYSGIGHIGYALVGLSAGTEAGSEAVLIYMAVYLVTTLGTFACILMMQRRGRYVEEISDLSGLSQQQPMIAWILAALMFSLAGIPPLAGFIGKFVVFMAAIDAGLVWLAILGVLTSVVGAFYYLRIIKLMFFDDTDEALDQAASFELRAVAAVSAILVTVFFFYPAPLLSAAETAAAALAR